MADGKLSCFCALLILATIALKQVDGGYKNAKSFTVDYEKNTFMKDGKPFSYVSGSIHYSRVPYYYWEDRLTKMYAAGLDAIQVYIPWNAHEPQPGVYDFEGQQDLSGFIRLADSIGLLVILRAGPYICGEWEFGGFPSWLLKNNGSVMLRTMDPGYIAPVDKWLSVLLPKILPLTYANGGPVIMVQVENEYGSFRSVDCGHDYMAHLRDQFRKHLGNDTVLFTTDGNAVELLNCGAIDGVFATVDFGPSGNVSASFDSMRQWNNNTGPLVNSECYTGWLDHWKGGHAYRPTQPILDTLKQTFELGASINLYMFEGGTNFGYTSGADPGFAICPTSYDYDSPLSEAGDTTYKYQLIRDLIGKYKKLPPGPVPGNSSKHAYGKVQMSMMSTVLDALDKIGPSVPYNATWPLSMEQVDQINGLILYRTVLTKSYPGTNFDVPGVKDRAYVLLDGVPQGLVAAYSVKSLMMMAKAGQTLDIIVENEGRINYGPPIIGQRKGLVSNVTFDSENLTDWKIYPLNLTRLFDKPNIDQKLYFRPRAAPTPVFLQPAVYTGTFTIPENMEYPQDTFLSMCGWWKGIAFINGFNLGRYWPTLGPQVTLFVPGGVIYPYPSKNTLIMVELESAPCEQTQNCYVSFTDTPKINNKCFSQASMEELPRMESPKMRRDRG